MGEPLAELMAQNPRPEAAVALFEQMMRDIMGGGTCADPMGQVRLRAIHGSSPVIRASE